MLFEGPVLQEPHPGGLRSPTLSGPRAGSANRVLLYLALRHCRSSDF
jgi:hypothetical protein